MDVGFEYARQVDVLSRAVDERRRSRLRKFTQHFLYAALNRGVFRFGAISPAQRRNRVSLAFSRGTLRLFGATIGEAGKLILND